MNKISISSILLLENLLFDHRKRPAVQWSLLTLANHVSKL